MNDKINAIGHGTFIGIGIGAFLLILLSLIGLIVGPINSEAGRGSRESGVKDSTFALHTSDYRTKFDNATTATFTRFLLYDVDNGQIERVSVGAADSGGAGFKLLRIAN